MCHGDWNHAKYEYIPTKVHKKVLQLHTISLLFLLLLGSILSKYNWLLLFIISWYLREGADALCMYVHWVQIMKLNPASLRSDCSRQLFFLCVLLFTIILHVYVTYSERCTLLSLEVAKRVDHGFSLRHAIVFWNYVQLTWRKWRNTTPF